MKISVKTFLFPMAVFPFFWDYYAFGLKLLDVAAFGTAVFCIIFLRSIHLNAILRARVLLFILFFTFYALIGFATSADLKGFLGLTFGIVFFTLVCMYFSVNDINKYSYWILATLVVTFFVQFFSSLFFGQPINYHAVIGEVPRLENSLGYRTAGLYLEPTSHCAMTFIIISTRFLNNHFGRWEAAGILTIFLSASLYGVFVAVTLLIMWAFHTERSKNLFLYVGALTIIFAPFIGFFVESMLSPHLQFLLFERLPLIATDASVSARYGLAQEGSSSAQLIFGSGLATLNSGARGTSGFGYLIGGVGFIGFLMFLLLLVNLFRARLLLIIPSIFVVLMSSYYWTFMAFWLWLAWIYISVSKQSIKSNNSVNKKLASGLL